MSTDRGYGIAYWDSCVFIDRLQETPGRITLLRDLTTLAEKGKLLIVTSTITIAEVLRLPDPELGFFEDLEKIHAYFEHEWISLRAPDRSVCKRASELRRSFSLK